MENSCYTYFKIDGNFDPDEATALLGLTPEKIWKIGELRRGGKTRYDFAHWEIGRCSEYDVEVTNQMEKTISLLQDKIPLLNKFRSEHDVTFWLEIVPSVYDENNSPCLAPSLAVIDFCHATRTRLDIDLYVYASAQE